MPERYYLLTPNDQVLNIWEIQGTVAWPFSNLGDSVQLQPGESLLDALKRQPQGSVYRLAEDTQLRLEECPRQFGVYYPRIYRPVFRRSEQEMTPRDEQVLISSLVQIATLTEHLTGIFRVIFPEAGNLDAYGHEIRNLILLACTEVEAQWKGILRANHALPTGGYFTTKDYVKLCEPLKLAEYQVALPMYPRVPPLSPFARWDSQCPSKSLPWYGAYNAVKHDRETEFPQAKLRYAIDAVVACAVMLEAQYGLIPAWRDQLGQFFRFEKRPQWSDREKYLPPAWTEWQLTDFPF